MEDYSRHIYHSKPLDSFDQACRASVIGRRIRPDLWWYVSNKDGVWTVFGYHLSLHEMRTGRTPAV